MRHGVQARLYHAPCGVAQAGRFGRMFPHLRAFESSDQSLSNLAAAMIDDAAESPSGDSSIPAGYTYLGQFIDHDITFDPTPIPDQRIDPAALRNFRTPKLELDSVYGLGPDAQPYLYSPEDDGKRFKLRIGETAVGGGEPIAGGMPNDLLRLEKDAIIGDKRNDENLAVAQTHLAFIKFHNKIVDQLLAEGVDESHVFEEARRLVTWHYQWIVLNDFLPRILEPMVINDILVDGRKYYQPIPGTTYMPVEFSGAAYRLGHSMVREVYSFNRVFTEGGLTPATLSLLFQFSGLSGSNVPVPSDWIIDWSRFYDLGTMTSANFKFNFARKLDPFAAPTLHAIPGGVGALPELNLHRGLRLELPSGQRIARHIGVAELSPDEIETGSDGAVAAAEGFLEESPLWYYILKEAQIRNNGQRLGAVGSLIVAEVFIGLLQSDVQSYLFQEPEWLPELSEQSDGKFEMADLLKFVDDINPIGDS